MAKPSEVTVTDAEVHAFYAAAYAPEQLQFEAHRAALAAFLAPRVPDAEVEPSPYAWDDDQINMAVAHNALRDAVLRGK